jgi:hypothetical protein
MGSYADKVRDTPQKSWSDLGQFLGRCVTHRIPKGVDVEMVQARAAETAVAISAVLNQEGEGSGLHLTKAQPNEQLPNGFKRSYVGFLIHDLGREVSVDQDIVKMEMEYLTNFVTTAFFVGGRPPMQPLLRWLEEIQRVVGSKVALGRDLGRGFFLLKTESAEVVTKIQMLTLYRTQACLCIFQKWVVGFDPHKKKNMASGGKESGIKIPTWVTLKQIPEEFQGVVHQIAASIGEVLSADSANGSNEEPKFCLALDSSIGWETVVVVSNDITGKKHTIAIDYNFLPIRCRFCFATDHCVKDCPSRESLQNRRGQQGQQRLPNKQGTPGQRTTQKSDRATPSGWKASERSQHPRRLLTRKGSKQ